MTSATIVLFLLVAGNEIARRSPWLRSLNIPGSFVAGIAGSLLLLALSSFELPTFNVSAELRDLLLVAFFVSAGLGTTVSSWLAAGRPLLILSLACIVLMILQNVVGIGVAQVLDVAPAYGVLSGSIAFVGGLGSAVAWGAEFGAKGVPHATEVAVIAATVGMTVGTFVGGPYVAWVMKRYRVSAPRGETSSGELPQASVSLVAKDFYVVLFLFALSIFLGDLFGGWLRTLGLITPRFLTAMLAGLAVSTVADLLPIQIPRPLVDRCGDIALSLFIVMALCTIDLRAFAQIGGAMALMTAAQTLATVLFTHFFVFRTMGRNFEAAATSGGFIGFGLSSFAVAMATVKQVERNYGPAPQSVLPTTLVGGAVSSVANAVVTMAFYQWLVG